MMDLISVDKCFSLIIILNILFIDKPINLPIDLSRAKIMRCIYDLQLASYGSRPVAEDSRAYLEPHKKTK